MSSPTVESPVLSLQDAVAFEARRGLTASPKVLPAWLFYDEAGSRLFEEITALPEYYLTRTERALFCDHADEVIETAAAGQPLTVIELGAGTATKSGLLLAAAARRQGSVLYQPIDVSDSALAEAEASLTSTIPGLAVVSQLMDYTSGPLSITRPRGTRVLALYIGSSIGNFDPVDAQEVLRNLRSGLEPGDSLLLGTDLAPGEHKSVEQVLSAYNDAAGVTAAFNLNVLARLNRDVRTNFDLAAFRHVARWNPLHSRIEMHLEAQRDQSVTVPSTGSADRLTLHFAAGETIHTENSYKFTASSIAALLQNSGFVAARSWKDPAQLFAVTLATAV